MKKFIKGLLMGIGVLVLGIIVLAFIFGDSDTDEPKKVASSSKGEASEPADKGDSVEDKVFKVGDTVEFEGIEVTLVSAAYSEPAEYSEPENGKIVTLEVEVLNKENKQKLLVDNTDFDFSDAEGLVAKGYYGYDENEIHGFVPTGKKIKGKLFYDVNESGKYEFTYKPSLHTSDITLTFDIEL